MQTTNPADNIARGVVRGTAMIALQRILDAVLGFIIVPFTLHRLGHDLYGLWALLYAFIAYLNLADLGFASSLNRFFTRAITRGDRREQYELLSTAFYFMLAISLGMILAAFALEPLVMRFYSNVAQYGSEARWAYRALALIIGLGYLTNYGRSLLVSSQRVDRLALFQVLIAILNAGMIFFVLSMGWGLIGLAAGSAALGVIRLATFFLAGIVTLKGWKIGLDGLRKSVLSELLRFGLVVQLSRIADLVNSQFDRLILGRVLNLRSVTSYDLGAKAATSAGILSQVVLYVIEPASSALEATGSKETFGKLILRSGKYVALLALAVAAYVLIEAGDLLHLWLGSIPDKQVILALSLLILAQTTNALVLPLRLASRGTGHPGWEARSSVIQAVLNIALSIGLFYLFGLLGVLLGTLIAAIVGNGILTYWSLRGLEQDAGRFFRTAWAGPLLVFLFASAGCWLVANQLPPVEIGGGRLDVLPRIVITLTVFSSLSLLFAIWFRVLPVSELRDLISRFKR